MPSSLSKHAPLIVYSQFLYLYLACDTSEARITPELGVFIMFNHNLQKKLAGRQAKGCVKKRARGGHKKGIRFFLSNALSKEFKRTGHGANWLITRFNT